MHYGYGYGFGGGGGGHPWLVVLMIGVMVVVVAVVAWIVVTLVRHRGGPASVGSPGTVPATAPGPQTMPHVAPAVSDGRRILDERFARGEIDEEEYRRRRSVIEGPG